MEEINKIILKVLDEVACNNTGSCQINLQSKTAQIMIADKITEALDPHFKNLIEDIVVGNQNELPR
tara:strand:+ start:102 stop:299 length:198 start_codon:yes stop_codon:yes gene_type:complete